MDDTVFQSLALSTLTHCFDRLDAAYEAGDLDELDLADGVLSLTTASGRIFLLNKHGPSQEIWLASPFSGGLHFVHDATKGWHLSDGTLLYDLLTRELARENVTVIL